MKGLVEVKVLTEEVIEVFGTKYYTEEYLIEMIRREYNKGLKDGQQLHVAQIEKCTNCF